MSVREAVLQTQCFQERETPTEEPTVKGKAPGLHLEARTSQKECSITCFRK